MKFKELRDVLSNSFHHRKIEISEVLGKDIVTVRSETYDTIFDVPDKYNKCKVVNMSHKSCSFDVIDVITIRNNKWPIIKIGDFRNHILLYKIILLWNVLLWKIIHSKTSF